MKRYKIYVRAVLGIYQSLRVDANSIVGASG
jgi:hypothetical protein